MDRGSGDDDIQMGEVNGVAGGRSRGRASGRKTRFFYEHQQQERQRSRSSEASTHGEDRGKEQIIIGRDAERDQDEEATASEVRNNPSRHEQLITEGTVCDATVQNLLRINHAVNFELRVNKRKCAVVLNGLKRRKSELEETTDLPPQSQSELEETTHLPPQSQSDLDLLLHSKSHIDLGIQIFTKDLDDIDRKVTIGKRNSKSVAAELERAIDKKQRN